MFAGLVTCLSARIETAAYAAGQWLADGRPADQRGARIETIEIHRAWFPGYRSPRIKAAQPTRDKPDYQCAVKGAGQQWVKFPPGNWFAPPGSNRSGSRGNEAAGASDVEGRSGDLASM